MGTFKRNFLTMEEIIYITNEIKKHNTEANKEIISVAYTLQFLLTDDKEFDKIKKDKDILKIYNYALEQNLYCHIHNLQNFHIIDKIVAEDYDINRNIKLFLEKVLKKINKTKPITVEEVSNLINEIKGTNVIKEVK